MLKLLPGPYIYHGRAQNHDKHKKDILPKIVAEYQQNKTKQSYKWAPNTDSDVTTNFNHSQIDFFTKEQYNDIIWYNVNRFFDSIRDTSLNPSPTKPNDIMVDSLWWNVYQPGDFVELHNHQPSGISGIYFLELTDKNSTMFVYDNQFPLTDSLPLWSVYHKADYVKEGDILLFPSKINHYVNPVKTRKVSISFNLYPNYQDIQL